jgi:serine/threonine-protein kinase
MSQGSEIIQPGALLAGRYRAIRRLGEGGMGSVYLVEHIHTDQKLALKVLHAAVVKDAATLDRFRREARTPARITSDHVVQVTDADVAPELGGVPFLVMEWLRGEDLGKVIEQGGPLPARDVVLYLQQAARALDKAHALGIIHRDLKPENLFLTTREDGTPCIKLLDFGIAKLTGASAGGGVGGASELGRAGSVTSTGQIFGTPLYMSPEQAKSELTKISPQTDVWALGLIAHKLLTGVDFWTADTLTHLIAQIVYEPLPAPSARGVDLGKAYDAWFLRCCARDPDVRFGSAGEAAAALADALGIVDMRISGSLSPRPSQPSHPSQASHPSQPSQPAAPKREASAFAETALDSQSLSQSAPPAGAQPGSQSGSQSGSQRASQSGSEPGSPSGSQSGAQAIAQSGSQSGARSASQSGSQSLSAEDATPGSTTPPGLTRGAAFPPARSRLALTLGVAGAILAGALALYLARGRGAPAADDATPSPLPVAAQSSSAVETAPLVVVTPGAAPSTSSDGHAAAPTSPPSPAAPHASPGEAPRASGQPEKADPRSSGPKPSSSPSVAAGSRPSAAPAQPSATPAAPDPAASAPPVTAKPPEGDNPLGTRH